MNMPVLLKGINEGVISPSTLMTAITYKKNRSSERPARRKGRELFQEVTNRTLVKSENSKVQCVPHSLAMLVGTSADVIYSELQEQFEVEKLMGRTGRSTRKGWNAAFYMRLLEDVYGAVLEDVQAPKTLGRLIQDPPDAGVYMCRVPKHLMLVAAKGTTVLFYDQQMSRWHELHERKDDDRAHA